MKKLIKKMFVKKSAYGVSELILFATIMALVILKINVNSQGPKAKYPVGDFPNYYGGSGDTSMD
ncbi:MAG: hypothetical protein K2Q18_04760 [Bdellovibrionales bacterium]|nr:hypothetical protein [Bdellovibrionales bacterium]